MTVMMMMKIIDDGNEIISFQFIDGLDWFRAANCHLWSLTEKGLKAMAMSVSLSVCRKSYI